MIRGYLPILVLQSIEEEPKTSYGIKEHIGSFWDKKPSSGSLFPVIHKLLCSKFIKIHNIKGKKIISITKKGSEHLDKLAVEKENNIVDHIILLEALGKNNSKREFNIIEKIAAKTPEHMKTKINMISKTIKSLEQSMKIILNNKIDKEQEQEFKNANSKFVKKIKIFNNKIKRQ